MQLEIARARIFADPLDQHRYLRRLRLHPIDESQQKRRFSISQLAGPVRLDLTVLDPFAPSRDFV
jgi:hypothetical protein